MTLAVECKTQTSVQYEFLTRVKLNDFLSLHGKILLLFLFLLHPFFLGVFRLFLECGAVLDQLFNQFLKINRIYSKTCFKQPSKRTPKIVFSILVMA